MFSLANSRNRKRSANAGQIASLPAASGGMNARDLYGQMPANDALLLQNLLVRPTGLVVRNGFTEIASGLPGAIGTLLSYFPAIDAGSLEAGSGLYGVDVLGGSVRRVQPFAVTAGKLFAAADNSLFDVTAGGSGPWTAEAGVTGVTDYWNGWNFQNIGGSFLTVTNWGGGYAYFDGTAWTAVAAGDGTGNTISGVDPDTFVYHFVFKGRLYFIERDSTRMWYLPAGQLTGVAKAWDFGAQFRHGGALQIIASWTQDAGEGIDDYFIAASSTGDLVIYKGYDPDNAPTDWQLHGVWYIGALPYGYRCWDQTGGDVMILAQYGAVFVSQVLGGQLLEVGGVASKVASLISAAMAGYKNVFGWSVRHVPSQDIVLIGFPKNAAGTLGTYAQLAFGVFTQAWSLLSDMPIHSGQNHDSVYYFGDEEGSVWQGFNGALDKVRLGQSGGDSIRGMWITSYQPLGDPGMLKVFPMVRPNVVRTGPFSMSVSILVNYQPRKQGIVVPVTAQDLSSKWDAALWDSATWAGEGIPFLKWFGTKGSGYVAAAQIMFAATGGSRFNQCDFWTVPGGPLV